MAYNMPFLRQGDMKTMRGMTMMAAAAGIRLGTSIPADRDRIVRRLDEFPELNRALRNGDVPTGRFLCAQLFNLATLPGAPLAMRAKAS